VEQALECVTELSTHSAVDEKVDRVAEHDTEVKGHSSGAPRFLAKVDKVKRILDDQESNKDGRWNLDEQECSDDDDEHQRREVAFL